MLARWRSNIARFARFFPSNDLGWGRSYFRAMLKNGVNMSRSSRIRVPEVITFGPLGRSFVRERLNARVMAASMAFLVAGVFLLVAVIQPIPRDGADRLGPAVARADTPKVDPLPLVDFGPLDGDAVTQKDDDAVEEEEGDAVAELAGEEEMEPAGDDPVEVAALGEANEPVPVRRIVTVPKGGTLMQTLVSAGTERRQAHEAIAALAKIFNPRRLQVGQEIRITSLPSTQGGADRLLSVTLPLSAEHEVAAVRTEDGRFVPDEVTRPLHREVVRVSGSIDDTLFLATRRAGVPLAVVMDAIRIFSWDLDFQRDIQPGDQFEFMFERFFNESGEAVKEGKVIFAALNLSGKEIRLYLHKLESGFSDYFDQDGQSARRALLRTPVDGARLSSGYGRRRHPILGYNRVHRGIDFAAPRGTPIVAAGDGVIEVAGRNGAYGRYVRIRHNGTYKTAYGHMNRIAKGMRPGTRVRQGQVIGYVGSTGRSTGPHLHYEVLTGGRQINPMKLRLPTGKPLAGTELVQFQERRSEIDALILAAAPLFQTAGN